MRAYTRNPNHDRDPVQPNAQLLLDDADDELVPLTPAAIPASIDHEPDAVASTRLIALPRWTPVEQLAYRELARFVSASGPTIGWRFVVFVVSGICLRPSQSERVLRASVASLLECVDPLILDPEKEASS